MDLRPPPPAADTACCRCLLPLPLASAAAAASAATAAAAVATAAPNLTVVFALCLYIALVFSYDWCRPGFRNPRRWRVFCAGGRRGTPGVGDEPCGARDLQAVQRSGRVEAQPFLREQALQIRQERVRATYC